VLIDCDGQVANEFLSRQRDLNGRPGSSVLGDAVLQADTLVLVVDASSGPDVLRRDFAQFARFLRLLEQGRSHRTEVGGLPAYLVLTKCDLLARKGDSLVGWMERIEEHKREVGRKFQEYLAQDAGRDARPFGKVELRLWATAVKHPALETAPARPREPYGVAELFRQCFQSAEHYRTQRALVGRRLHWTVAGLGGLVVFLVLLGLLFWATRPDTRAAELETRIQSARAAQPKSAATRFQESGLDKQIKQLEELKTDPAFGEVAPEGQAFVVNSLKELRAYKDYSRQVRDVVKELRAYTNSGRQVPDAKPPQQARTVEELAKLEQRLDRLASPPAWRGTEAAEQRELYRHEAALLRREADRAAAAFTRLRDRWRQVEKKGGLPEAISREASAILEEEAKLPYKEDNRDVKLPGALTAELTYGAVLDLDRVSAARALWLQTRPRVVRFAGR
jgi:hypothetical protein